MLPGPLAPRPRHSKRLFRTAMAGATQSGWSLVDVLCTANHFIAREIAAAIRHRLPDHPPVDEVIISGGGQLNGFLMQLITEQLPNVPLLTESELGVPHRMRSAAVAAVLALWHLDQLPGCPTAITGAHATRAWPPDAWCASGVAASTRRNGRPPATDCQPAHRDLTASQHEPKWGLSRLKCDSPRSNGRIRRSDRSSRSGFLRPLLKTGAQCSCRDFRESRPIRADRRIRPRAPCW